MNAADAGLSATYPYTTEAQLVASPYARTVRGERRPAGMGLLLVRSIIESISRS